MLLLLPAFVSASTCDVKALTTALAEASPLQVGNAYAALVACDPGTASSAAAALSRMLPGEPATAALVVAIGAGQLKPAQSWLAGLESSDRSASVKALGRQCDQAGVAGFFVASATDLPDAFWKDRWYGGLEGCKDKAAQELLRARITSGNYDRTQFVGVLETYCRNLGRDAMPTLISLLGTLRDVDLQTYVVSVFADVAATDPNAVSGAVDAIVAAAPGLGDGAVDQARKTLYALGAEEEADGLVLVRYKGSIQPDGGLLYGVYLKEVATCKKGDVRVEVHHAAISTRGTTWPDQVGERAAGVIDSFDAELGSNCKGTSKIDIVTPTAPFTNMEAYQAWARENLSASIKAHAELKVKELTHDPATM